MSTPTLLLDCDGVLADTERDGHLVAFNKMFDELGVPARWSDQQYAELLRIGGGKERLMSFLTPERAEAMGIVADEQGRQEVIAQWHAVKTRIFRELIDQGEVPPRPGVARLIQEALDAGWNVAVASTSAEESVRAVLTSVVGEDVAARVPVYAGDVIKKKKPAPDIYLHALQELDADPRTAVVVEDSAVGCRSAVAAELPVIVTVSGYTAEEDFSGAALVLTDLGTPQAKAKVLVDPHNLAQEDVVVDVALLQAVLRH